MMKLKIRNGLIYDEATGKIMAVSTPDANEDFDRTVQLGSELIPEVENFIDGVNAGSFKKKSVVDRFTNLIERFK